MLSRPELVFADEPTGNLDSRAGAEILRFLRRAVDEFGQTIVMVSHDPIAASSADRIVFLADGRVVDEMSHWRNIMRHKTRTGFLSLCVVIGVSFVAGTFVLTDTMTNVFTQIFDQAYAGVAVSVRSQSDLGTDAARPPTPDTVLDTVRAVPGVRVAEGGVFTIGGRIIDADGNQVGNQFAPTFLASWPTEPEFSAFTLVDGAPPAGAGEIVVDLGAATEAWFVVGDDIRVQTTRGLQTFRLVGIARYGTASNMGGASAVLFDLAMAQTEAGRVGSFDDVSVAASEGTDALALKATVQTAVGRSPSSADGAVRIRRGRGGGTGPTGIRRRRVG